MSTWHLEIFGNTCLCGPGEYPFKSNKNILEAEGNGWELRNYRIVSLRKPEQPLEAFPHGILKEEGMEELYYEDHEGSLHPCNLAFAWHVVNTGEVPCDLDGVSPLIFRGFYVPEISQTKTMLKNLRAKRRQAMKEAGRLFNITTD